MNITSNKIGLEPHPTTQKKPESGNDSGKLNQLTKMKKETKHIVSQYHHPIKSSNKITNWVDLKTIYDEVITNKDYYLYDDDKGDPVTLSRICEFITAKQQQMNALDPNSAEWAKLKRKKTEKKERLHGAFYQVYKPTSKKGNLNNTYTGYVVIDIDGYARDFSELKTTLRGLAYVAMYFTSPSGGIKIIIKTDLSGTLNTARYSYAYNLVISELGLDCDLGDGVDDSAKTNQNLICYYSYDKNAYYNASCEGLSVQEATTELAVSPDGFESTANSSDTTNSIVLSESTGNKTDLETAADEFELDNGATTKNTANNEFKKLSKDKKCALINLAYQGYLYSAVDNERTEWLHFNWGLVNLLGDDYPLISVALFPLPVNKKGLANAYNSYEWRPTGGFTAASIYKHARSQGWSPTSIDSAYVSGGINSSEALVAAFDRGGASALPPAIKSHEPEAEAPTAIGATVLTVVGGRDAVEAEFDDGVIDKEGGGKYGWEKEGYQSVDHCILTELYDEPEAIQKKLVNVANMSFEQSRICVKENIIRDDFNYEVPDYIYPVYDVIDPKTFKEKLNHHGKRIHYVNKKSDVNAMALVTYLGVEMKKNLIREDIEVEIPPLSSAFIDGLVSTDTVALDDTVKNVLNLNGFPKEAFKGMLSQLVKCNQYNPLTDMCKSLPWDGIDRIKELTNTVTVPPEELEWFNQCFKRWLIQCVAAWDIGGRNAKHPEAKRVFGTVLVFVGGQSVAKTAFFKSLLPTNLSDYVISTGLDLSDKDSLLKTIENGIVEFDEICQSFKKNEINALKSFITNDVDVVRRPYATKAIKKPRATSFCGSSNNIEFLRDPTGNKRFAPVTTLNIDIPTGKLIDRQQLWAQAWHEYSVKGAKWWMENGTPEKALQDELLPSFTTKSELDEFVDEYFVIHKHDKVGSYRPNQAHMMSVKEIREVCRIYSDEYFNGYSPKPKQITDVFKLKGASNAVRVKVRKNKYDKGYSVSTIDLDYMRRIIKNRDPETGGGVIDFVD